MSGILAALAGAVASGGVNAAWAASAVNISNGVPAVRTASVTFYPDGTSSQAPYGAPPNWFAPTTAGIGAGWSVRVTGTGAGTSISGMASGTWYSLATARTVAYSNSASNNLGYGTAAVAFSLDGGATVVNAGSIDWDVGYEP